MKVLKWIGIVAVALIVAGILAVTALVASRLISDHNTNVAQAQLDPFYTPPAPLPQTLGTVIRTEPLGITVQGGTAQRFLYVSETPTGTRAASGAMIFIPSTPAPPGGRPVVAWSHGTLGLGAACAPSRSTDPTADISTWLPTMMKLGWVVVATDYVGIGTPGPNLYLDADSEVRDVVNSVRAARNIPQADASNRYVTFGHSQGGHASIWAGWLGPKYAPELTLMGVAAAAPALELKPIMSAQWDTLVGWVIGPAAVESWTHVYPDLPITAVLTNTGRADWSDIAYQCVKNSALTSAVRQAVGQRFFASNPAVDPAWSSIADQQTPAPLPASMPVFITQGMTDEVVLPWPQAILQETWCAAGSALTMDWLGQTGHVKASLVGGPNAVPWIADRFAGLPAGDTCNVPPAVAPVDPTNDASASP